MAQAARNLDRHFREDLYARIVIGLQQMPEELREVFILSHYEGRSLERIAQALGIPPEQVAGLLEEADSRFKHTIISPLSLPFEPQAKAEASA